MNEMMFIYYFFAFTLILGMNEMMFIFFEFIRFLLVLLGICGAFCVFLGLVSRMRHPL